MTVATVNPTSPLLSVGLGRLLRSTAVSRLTIFAFCVGLAYLVLLPLFRLQQLALEDGASGYERAWNTRGIRETLVATIGLALGSLVIALVLGTLLAWAATRLPPRLRLMRVLPIFPIIVPAVASVTGWAFLFSPRPGYLNALLRNLPWWNHLDEGPVDIYTLPWIIIITGFGLTSFVYIFVSSGFQNISAETIEAAHSSGSRSVGVFFKVILPLLRPTLVYGGGVALLLGLGQFTGPLLLGRNTGITVLTTQMY
ncbi:MAG TPA: ABC transporter permease subunit, partial [Ilumatobacter sp.]|nr:ABC transporter permease subunit [Ilumatobacter sp.]